MDLGFRGLGCLNLDEWGGFVKTVVSSMMKTIGAEGCHGLILLFFLVSFAIEYGCSSPCMWLNCVQLKEAGSTFPFVTWATALVCSFCPISFS